MLGCNHSPIPGVQIDRFQLIIIASSFVQPAFHGLKDIFLFFAQFMDLKIIIQ